MATEKIPCGGWYIDESTLSFDENKVLSVIGGGGASGVASFNGRTGVVAPQNGDYTAEQVGALPISGGTMTGNIDLGDNNLDNVSYVKAAGTYENAGIQFSSNGTIINFVTGYSTALELSANTVNVVNHTIDNVAGIGMSNSGTITGLGEPTNDEDAANKQYVDNIVFAVAETVNDILDGTETIPYLPDNGGTLTGALNMGNNKITMGATPTETTDVTNKGYVDGVVKVVSDEVDGIITGTTPISVPIATDTKVGGVKIGAGLSVDGEGTLTTAQTYLSTQGGTLEANASITGEDEMTFEVPDSTESATVGITAQGVTIVHNTNSASNARIRVIENNVEIEADGTIVSFDPSGVDFGAGVITNVSSIGGASNGEIAFENTIDLNNHQAKNVADPTEAQDGATKNYVDSRTGNASTSTRGVVLQATGVTDATSADDIITQFNALLASLRTSGVLQDNT